MSKPAASSAKRRHRRYCCVVNCHEQEGLNPGVHFYRFPSKPHEVEQRERWIRAAQRTEPDGKPWQPTQNSRMCSRHFVGNKKSNCVDHPAYAPTIFPPAYKRPLPLDSSSGLERFDRCAFAKIVKIFAHLSKSIKIKKKLFPLLFACTPKKILPPAVPVLHSEPSTSGTAATTPVTVVTSGTAASTSATAVASNTAITTSSTAATASSTALSPQLTRTLGVGPHARTCFFGGYDSIKHSPDALRSLCGVDGNVFALLLSLLPTVRDRGSDVTVENKMLIFLTKMKLGISFSAVATLFGVHETTACRTFYAVLYTLAEVTRGWISKPPVSNIKLAQPLCFQENYPECTLIVDCTEIKTETPPNIRQQHVLYSSYKGGYTLKFLVGIIPNGMVVFRSKPYGGRCSDTYITLNSGFLSVLESDDVVLADKGFPGIRASLADRGVVLVMPPFSAGSNVPFTPEEMEETYAVASVRIHVERMIQRIKLFDILNHRVPISLIPAMGDIFHMCCVLANLQPHIISS
ncbi:unnamed protein product [Ixodes pacificus]